MLLEPADCVRLCFVGRQRRLLVIFIVPHRPAVVNSRIYFRKVHHLRFSSIQIPFHFIYGGSRFPAACKSNDDEMMQRDCLANLPFLKPTICFHIYTILVAKRMVSYPLQLCQNSRRDQGNELQSQTVRTSIHLIRCDWVSYRASKNRPPQSVTPKSFSIDPHQTLMYACRVQLRGLQLRPSPLLAFTGKNRLRHSFSVKQKCDSQVSKAQLN